jgi:hypothetical protein
MLAPQATHSVMTGQPRVVPGFRLAGLALRIVLYGIYEERDSPRINGPDINTIQRPRWVRAESTDRVHPLIPQPAADGIAPGGGPIIKHYLVQRDQGTVAELGELRRKHPIVSGDVHLDARLYVLASELAI